MKKFRGNSTLLSIWKQTCPKCHQGKLYKTSFYEMQGIYNMYEKCPKCKQDFNIETGFYWGAMYIGYGLHSFYLLGGVAILMLGLGWSIGSSMTLLIVLSVIALPEISRWARSIWIHIYVPYNRQLAQKIWDEEQKK